MSQLPQSRRFPAIAVEQWLETWDLVPFADARMRRKPEPKFYVTSLPASVLKALSGVEHRSVEERRKGGKDVGIQRALDNERMKEIARYIESGYPWSELSPARREDPDFKDLRMPGWLPTAIVINIKVGKDQRPSGKVDAKDLVAIEGNGPFANIVLPESMKDLPWDASDSFPIEIIDGQHRLWAFDLKLPRGDFNLPVVAFHGLDVSWQAYLFYVINIKPKKINPSLAFDLYPLLRSEDWLEKTIGHDVYREARAQELTQALWAFPQSPWYQRINMLGTPGEEQVRQASWVRNLTNTMIRKAEGARVKVGGLFGTDEGALLRWTRTEQAAFLIFAWSLLAKAVRSKDADWATSLRGGPVSAIGPDPAFAGRLSLLNTDQGIRGILHVLNDMLMVRRDELKLDSIRSETPFGEPTPDDIDKALYTFENSRELSRFLYDLTDCLASFDWRTSDAPGLTDDDRTAKKTFRGSGGYKELRIRLLRHLSRSEGLAGAAEDVASRLAYDLR
jgi:hypothetical protein